VSVSKAGDYKFPSPITPLSVLQRLEQGEQRMIRLTVIEGWTPLGHRHRNDPRARVRAQGFDRALNLMEDVKQIKDMDRRRGTLRAISIPIHMIFRLTPRQKQLSR